MRCVTTLPQGYQELLSIDLQKDKKMALIVNGIALGVMAVLAAIGNVLVPISTLFHGWNMAIMGVGTVVYMVLHEMVHGMCMKCFGAQRVKYGFTGLYAYAGSKDYFGKRAYIIVALAPVVVWGMVLLLMGALVDHKYFWGVYFIQIANLSGAAGDFYVSYLFSKLPKDILIQDTGISMVVCAPSGETDERRNPPIHG